MTCAASDLEYLEGSTGILTVTLEDEDGVALNGAVVQVTLYHEDGTEVEGETWPITMNYVALSEGEYTVEVTALLEVELNEILKLVGVATFDSKARKFNRKIPVVEG